MGDTIQGFKDLTIIQKRSIKRLQDYYTKKIATSYSEYHKVIQQYKFALVTLHEILKNEGYTTNQQEILNRMVRVYNYEMYFNRNKFTYSI